MAPMRVFVSHSQHNASFCQDLVRALRGAGADVWYDEDNMNHGQLMKVVQRELDNRPVFIVILSPEAFASEWVHRETLWAYDLIDDDPTRIILPVTATPIERANFTGQSGWLFLRDFKRIEASKYQPYAPQDAIRRTLRALALTMQGENPFPVAPQPTESTKELIDRGKALSIQARYEDALVLFQRASQLAPDSSDAWFQLGITLHDMQRLEEAAAAYDQAITLNSNAAPIWRSKAILLKQLGLSEEAEIAETQAQSLEGASGMLASDSEDTIVSKPDVDVDSGPVLTVIDTDVMPTSKEEYLYISAVDEVKLPIDSVDANIAPTIKEEASSKLIRDEIETPTNVQVVTASAMLSPIPSEKEYIDDLSSSDSYVGISTPPSSEEHTALLPPFSKIPSRLVTRVKPVLAPKLLEQKPWQVITVMLVLLITGVSIFYSSLNSKSAPPATLNTVSVRVTSTSHTVQNTPKNSNKPTTTNHNQNDNVTVTPTQPQGGNVPIAPTQPQVPIQTQIVRTSVVPTATQSLRSRTLSVKTPSRSLTINATGQGTTSATFASGKLQVTNSSTDSTKVVNWPIGTVLSSSINSSTLPTLVLDQSVNLPAPPASSTIIVPAHAQVAGSQGNMAANAFLIHCHAEDTNRGYCYGATNVTDFTGGAEAQSYTFVQQSDIDAAAKSLEATPPASQQVLQGQLVANEHLVGTPSCIPQVSSDHAANDRALTVTVTVVFTCNGQAQS